MGVTFSVESYGGNKKTYEDYACFSPLWSIASGKIIYFPKKTDKIFSDDLKEIGFQFTEEEKGFAPKVDGVSFTEILGTLTVLRYLEEEPPIKDNYHEIKKILPGISKWEALQLAHQKSGGFVNDNHTLLIPKSLVRYTPWKEVKQRLSALPLWENSRSRHIHDSYGTYGGYSNIGTTIKQLHEELQRGKP